MQEILQKRYTPYIIFLFLTLLCYLVILWNGYSFDDIYIIDNANVKQGIYGLKKIWQSPFITTYTGKEIDYRPIPLSLYALEYQFFGQNPIVNHFVSLILYFINVSLLYFVSIRVFHLNRIHKFLPLFITILYCVHPSHVEVVASLKNRDEILSFIFILIATLFFDKCFNTDKNMKRYLFIIYTILFFYFSIFSKLVSLPFWACIFLWGLYNKYYKTWKVFIPMLLISIIIIYLHFLIFQEYYERRTIVNFYENPLKDNTNMLIRLGLGFNTILFYIKFLIFPYPFRFYFGYNVIPFESIFNPIPLLSFLVFIFLVLLLIYSIFKRKYYSYYLFCFIGFILFYSNIIFKYVGVASERSMYQFSFFFIAFIVLFIFSIINNKPDNKNKLKRMMLLFIIFFVGFVGLTINRSLDWKDTVTLVLKDIKFLKNSELANYLTAFNCYEESIKIQDSNPELSKKYAYNAEYFFQEAIKLAPEWDRNYYHLGNLYKYILNDNKLAELNYKIGIHKENTIQENIFQELASLLFIQGKYEEAIPYYESAVKKSPENIELAFYKVLNLYNAKQLKSFLVENKLLLEKYPEQQYAYLNYATYYTGLQQTDSIINNLELAVKYGCNSKEVINYLYQFYIKSNNKDKIEFYTRLQNSYN